MACRMLVATGRLPMIGLLDGFKLMARNENERHEYRDRPDRVHGDGWGIVTGRKGALTCYKNAVPCWSDPRFADLYGATPDFMMLHARKASPGIPVEYEFTHPYEEDGWYFCHNGTVRDLKVEGRSDTQQLFALILHNARQCGNIAEAIGTTAKSLREYSALNFMLLRDDHVYILNLYGKPGEKTPNYFTMKYLQADGYAVVSSERLPGFDQEWQEMKNGTLLTLTIRDRTIQISDVWRQER